MKRSIKSWLACFLALAVLASYSFSPQNLTAFAVTGVENQQTHSQEETQLQTESETEATESEEATSADPQEPTEEQTKADSEEATDAEDEKESETKETEPSSEDAEKYPAVSFSESAGGVSVKIKAPEGALPEGTTVKVTAVPQKNVIDAVQDAVGDGTKVTKIKAVDITFQNKDGKEIEPNKEISVSLRASGMNGGAEQKAFHISDDGDVEFVADASSGSATFQAGEFSTYGIEESVEAYTVRFFEDANDTEPYETIYCEKDTAIGELPSEPSKEGATFRGWFVKGSDPEEEVTAETTVTADMDVVAGFTGMVSVRFVMNNDEGEELITKYDLVEGTKIGTMPQHPFKEGYEFVKWVKQGTDEEVTADTIVPENGMVVEAVFKEIKIYDVTVKYYYVIDNHRVDFGQDTYEIEEDDAPYTITPPASTKVDEAYIATQPTYYPSEPTIQVTTEDLANADEDNKITKEVEYVEYTAEYDFVYYLKNLNGQGYSEIERTHVKGVMGSTVTPTILEYDYATLERVEPVSIEEDGQELPVYYERKNFTLHYDTNGGSYVASTTAPYETVVPISDATPTRTGYTFQGWFTDSALTQPAGDSLTLTEDATLYAKWKGETVDYTIVYMKEKYDNSTGTTSFVYDNSRTAQGTVGTEVVATSAPNLDNNVNGYEKDNARNAESKVTIAADGSSVLTVYYKLIRYDLKFVHRSTVDYGYYNITFNNASLSQDGNTYTGTQYVIEDVVLGQNIADKWPTNVTSGRSGYEFVGWDYTTAQNTTTTRVTKVTELTWELVVKASDNHVATFNARYISNANEKAVEYWLQQPDGSYQKSESLSQTYYANGSLSPKDVAGYSQHNGDASAPSGYEGSGYVNTTEQVLIPAFDDTQTDYGSNRRYSVGDTITLNGHTYTVTSRRSGGRWDYYDYYYTITCHEDEHYEDVVVKSVYTDRFYYDRKQYTITYYDGGTELKVTDPIYFEANINNSTYNYTPSKPAGKEDYTWGGWYADSGLNTPYTFNTMPSNNLALYAKWIAPKYNVTFDLQGGSATFDTSKEVDKGSTVSSPGSPTKDNYIFDGWYTGPEEDSALYDWAKPITGDTTIYAHWKQRTLSYTVHYYEAGTQNRLLADKNMSSQSYTVGDVITENALSVAGYRPDASSKNLTLSFDGDNVITFYYSKREGTITYTVNYVLKDHPEIKVHESKTKTVDNTQVSVREAAVKASNEYIATQTEDEDILRDSYYPLEDTKDLMLSSDADNNVITFEYTNFKTSKVTVNYLDMDGNSIKDSVSSYEKAGSTYQVVTPSINGYIFHNKEDNNGESHSSYKIDGNGDLTINLYYQKKLKITAVPKNKTYDGTALESAAGDYTVDGLETGHTLTGVTFRGSQTDVGSSNTIPSNARITGPESSNYYHITYVPGTLTVTPKAVVINANADRWNNGPAYNGQARTIGFRNHGSEIEFSDASYEALYGADIRAMVSGVTLTKIDAGFYTIPETTIRSAITLPDDPNYVVTLNVRAGELTIPKAPLTVTTGSDEKGYDGTPLTKDEATITGLVNNETATIEATGSQTEVGESDNTYTITWGTAKANNYEISETLGKLKVTKNATAVVLTAPSDSKTYDGTALTCDGTGEKKVTATGLPEGFSVEATATGSQTNAGSSNNVVDDGFVIKNADKKDVTALFTNVTKAPGTLTVNKAPVTITTGSDSKAYDGTALTKDEAGITGLVNGETATVTATGSQTEVGSSLNTYSIDWGTTNKDNYEVTENLGTLTVAESTVEVTLTAPSDSKTYDGTALTCDGTGEKKVTASGLPEGFYVEATATGSQTDAGEGANVVNDGYVIKDADGNDKTSNFTNIKKVNGTLTVNPAPLTITTGGGTKAYDGTPLTNAEAGIEGLVNNETATVTAIGTITEVGSVENGYTINWGTAKAVNYTITENKGTLTVTNNSSKVTITAPSDEKTYDGTALTCDGTGEKKVTTSGLPEGFTVEATVDGSQKNAGESANTIKSYKIKNAADEDVTRYFTDVDTVDGTLKVNPRTLTIKTGSASKEYDGTALTNTDDTTVTGLVTGEVAVVTTTGTITDPGSETNSYTINWLSADPNNYTISEDLGTLRVTNSSISVTLTAATDSKTYDGTALKNDGVTATAKKTIDGHEVPVNLEALGFTVVATASGSQTDAGSSANVVNEGYAIKKGDQDVTSFFTSVETVNGTLTVNPKEVTITTGSDSKAYDGTALTNADAGITGLVNNETATVTATGSQTEVGSSKNTYSISWGDTKSTNYTIKENLGTLTVTDNKTQVTLTAPSDSKTYDGTALTCDGTGEKKVTASGLPEGFYVEATANGSQTDAGSSANVVNEGYVIKTAAGVDKTANFTNVKKESGTLTVSKAPVTITTGTDSKEYDGTALTNADAGITGLVNNETATVTATGSQTEVGSSANTYSISWGTAKAGNYTITENLGTLTITESNAQVTLTAPSDSKNYDGTALTCDGNGEKKVTASGLPEGFKVEATASGSQTDAGSSANVVDDGYVIKNAAGVDKTANFKNVKKVDGTLTVNKVPVTITTGSGSKAYDGTALTNADTGITGLVNNETATVTATGSQTEVGSSDNTYSIDWGTTNKDNYTITENLGTLTVTESSAQVTLTAPSDSKTYDGTALTCDGTGEKKVTASGLPAGFYVEATATGSQTDAGHSANVVNDGYVIRNAAGVDKTSSFTNVAKVDGTLTVNPKAITITTGSDSKAYDGTPLTKNEASIDGLVEGESVTLAAVGTITEVGETPNTYAIRWDNADKNNYTITENLGTLTITNNSTEITLTAPSDTKTYDGTALTCDGTGEKKVTASGLPEGFYVEATATGSQTDAGESANVVKDDYVIKNAAGENKTANFTNVTKVAGKLTVTPAKVTITTGSDSKAYDGTALTKAEASITGLVNNETATVTATGSQTEVGESDNTYSIKWGTAKAANYTITEKLGELKVTTNNAEITLTAPSDSKTYDGTALTCDGTGEKKVTASGLPEGFYVEAKASGSQTDAGESANVVKDNYVIKNAAGVDKTANFTNVTKVAGTLKVNPAALTVTTGGGTKAYDGKALTNSEASITGFVNGETATVTATGSQTEVGESDNTYSIKWGTAKAANYTITEKLGELKVTTNNAEITLTAPSDSKTYDGTALTADGTGEKKVTASGLPSGFTVQATATGSQTDAGSSSNVVNDGFIIKNAAGENKTANFTNVKKAPGTLTVSKAPVTIKTGSDSKEYDGTALTKADAGITGLVNNETATVTATGSQTEVGHSDNTYSIDWGTTNKDNYEVTENLGTLTVSVNTASITLTAASDNKTYDGTALTNSTVTASGLPAGFTVEATASGSQTAAGKGDNVVNNGYVIKNAAGEDKTNNFTNVEKVKGTLTVNPAPVTITTGSDSKAYDGTALTKAEASITGLKNGETATVTATGSQTEVGSSDNTYSIDWGTTNKDNYTITENLGTLTVTESSAQVTLTAPSDSKTYDGTALTCDGTGEKKVTASGLPAGFYVEATATGSQTDAGESANVVNDGYVIRNAAGEDKTANFTGVTKVDGKLTVNPKTVTITTGSDSKAYDGTPLTKNVSSVTGLAAGENVKITVTGSQTEVGNSSNTYSIDWGTTNKDNYTITENLGTLTVTENNTEITLTAPSDEKTYDGTALTCDGTGEKKVTARGLPEGFYVEATATGSQTDAGESANVVNNGYVIKTADGEDKTENFNNIVKVNGKLTVNKASITITTGSDSKAYDGTALTKAEASITGLVNNETATVAATGSQTEVGVSDNTYKINWGTAKAANYTITEKLGELKVTTNNAEITLTAPSDSKTYDGTALTCDGSGSKKVTASGLPEGFYVEAKASGSQTDAGESANVVKDNYVIKNAAGVDKTANFTNVTKVDGTLKVNPAALTVTTGGGSKAYDGIALTNDEASITGFVHNETATATATGSQTEVGESDNTYSISWGTAKAANYTITEKLGKLKVTANNAKITLTAPSDSKTYDGTALTCDGTGEKKVTASGLPDGFTVVATASGSQTDAGESANQVAGYVIKNSSGEDKTANFTNVEKVAGTLKVNPAALTVTTGGGSKAYDGIALTNDEASITGFVHNETATATATGSQTEVGESDNTYSISWGTAKAANYTITEKLGKLKVTTNNAEITLTAPSDTKTYDGTALTCDGTGEKKVTASGLPAGFTVEATATGSQTDAGSSSNVVNNGYIIKNAAGENKTANFTNVKKAAGTLTVEKATITIKTGTDSKPYDGTALTNAEASIAGLQNGETATVTATGSQTEIGHSDNTYTIKWGTAKLGNYKITEELGTLTVSFHTAQVILTAASASRDYNGKALTNSTVTASDLPTGFTVVATANGSQTDVGESANKVNDGYVIKNAAGADKTANFTNVKKVDGTLKVTPKAVKVTADAAGKIYGADEPTLTATITGVVEGDEDKIKYNISREEGEGVGSYDINVSGEKDQGNYTVTFESGTFTITKDTMTLLPTDYNGEYDGASHEAKVVSNVEGTTIEYSTDGGKTWTTDVPSIKNAGTLTVMIRATNPNYEDATATLTMTVTQKEVVIRTGSATKVYDGTALRNATATISGLVGGDKATVQATGSRTAVGTSTNGYSINWGSTNANNYKITESLGSLVITPYVAPTPTPTPPEPTPTPTPNPTPARAATPAAPAAVVPPAPAVPAVAAPAPATITDNPAPTTINDPTAPMAAPEAVWALLNLLCMIATALLSLIMLIRYFGKRKEENEETGEVTEIKRKGLARLISLIPAIGAIIAFILTEDLGADMVMTDKWTLLMIIILIIQIIVAIVAKTKKTEDSSDEGEATA